MDNLRRWLWSIYGGGLGVAAGVNILWLAGIHSRTMLLVFNVSETTMLIAILALIVHARRYH